MLTLNPLLAAQYTLLWNWHNGLTEIGCISYFWGCLKKIPLPVRGCWFPFSVKCDWPKEWSVKCDCRVQIKCDCDWNFYDNAIYSKVWWSKFKCEVWLANKNEVWSVTGTLPSLPPVYSSPGQKHFHHMSIHNSDTDLDKGGGQEHLCCVLLTAKQ